MKFQIPEWPVPDDNVRAAAEAMLQDGSWGRYHGPHCDALRTALREFHQRDHVILCCSGTAAMELALRALPVQAADEVILSAYDFKANFINVLTVGAIPVLVDTLPGIPVIDWSRIEPAFTDRTRAIIVSHLHGCLAPVQRILQIARARGVSVIEDACQVPGAFVDGQRAGATGDVGVLSFGGSKLLTSGRGGCVMTSQPELAQRIRLYTQRGNDAYPLSEMQAALLLPQLSQLDARNQERWRKVSLLRNQFHCGQNSADSPDANRAGAPLAAIPMSGNEHSVPAFYKIPILMASLTADDRDLVCQRFRSCGIPIDPAFPGLHRVHSRRRFRAAGTLDNADLLHQQLTTLHHTALLLPDRELIQLAERILAGLQSREG